MFWSPNVLSPSYPCRVLSKNTAHGPGERKVIYPLSYGVGGRGEQNRTQHLLPPSLLSEEYAVPGINSSESSRSLRLLFSVSKKTGWTSSFTLRSVSTILSTPDLELQAKAFLCVTDNNNNLK